MLFNGRSLGVPRGPREGKECMQRIQGRYSRIVIPSCSSNVRVSQKTVLLQTDSAECLERKGGREQYKVYWNSTIWSRKINWLLVSGPEQAGMYPDVGLHIGGEAKLQLCAFCRGLIRWTHGCIRMLQRPVHRYPGGVQQRTAAQRGKPASLRGNSPAANPAIPTARPTTAPLPPSGCFCSDMGSDMELV